MPDLTPENHAMVDKLNITITHIENLVQVKGHLDRVFSHADAVIVRPDRYVFGHTSADIDINTLVKSLVAKLDLNQA